MTTSNESKHILITGGAGFIGSHLADELIRSGYRVRILDNLDPQVHGPEQQRPEYLHPEVELMVGDVRNPIDVQQALRGIDAVFHLAAKVGVGQSMYEIQNYTEVNNLGTAVLLQQLIDRPVQKLVVASSMSIYGEGLYKTHDGRTVHNASRSLSQLKAGEWELRNDKGEMLTPVPTPEEKHPELASVYALQKYDQERLCLITGQAYNIPVTALRFFNVYGPRQALSNPYTGVLAIFASRLLNDNAPKIFEDGNQQRDFVSVYDVARACRLALESEAADQQVMNIGSGNSYTVVDIANALKKVLNKDPIYPEITGKYRMGDIRHCYADISKASELIGYKPGVALEDGLHDLSQWLEGQIAQDHVEQATTELASRGLAI